MSSAEMSRPNQKTINVKSIAKYALLPGLFPRLRKLSDSFNRFFFTFVQMFAVIGLIDKAHPCLKPQNIGLYRFRDIVGLAASNLRYDRQHLPQAIMFWLIIRSLVMTIGIFLLLATSLFFHVGSSYAQFFGEPSGNQYTRNGDWALQFLFRVFGDTVDITPTGGGHNSWFGAIFMAALQHYSLAMLVIVVFMILYILIITATEAARTGQPFGTRFDGIWAPVRMALAIVLLVPVAGPGLNIAQLLVIQSAVWGSNLATNAWFAGIERAGSDNLLSASMADPGYRFVRDAFLINSCVAALQSIPKETGTEWGGEVRYVMSFGTDKVTFSFGPSKASDFCGQASVGILPNNLPGPGGGNTLPYMIADAYEEVFYSLLPIGPPIELPPIDPRSMAPVAEGLVRAGNRRNGPAVIPPQMEAFLTPMASELVKLDMYDYSAAAARHGGSAQTVKDWVDMYRTPMGYGTFANADLGQGFFATAAGSRNYPAALRAFNDWVVQSLREDAQYGWASAGVFYIRLSGAMNVISKVVDAAPMVEKLPMNFTRVYSSPNNPQESADIVRSKCGWFDKFIALISFSATECEKYELSLRVNTYLRSSATWFQDVVKNDPQIYSDMGATRFDQYLRLPDPESPENITTDVVLAPVSSHLFENFRIDNQLNPLGTIISMGDTLLRIGMAVWIGAAVAATIGMGAAIWTVAQICLFCGFIMMFWVPFMPFFYFMFAVVEWIVSVMEAVIGMPLWATTLISLEGDGLGRGTEGVKMIFEIILRPTIIILSLLVSVILFGASVHFVNQSMGLYANGMDQITSAGMQSIATSLGMVVVYMFMIFMLATSCFKLIADIPDYFGRWGGLPAGFGSMIHMGPQAINQIVGFLAGRELYGAIGKAGQQTVRDKR